MRQADRVLAYIEEHGSITPWEAFERLRITRLSAVIFNLKKFGYDIVTIRHNSFRDGEWVRWAEYAMKEPLPVGWETAHTGNEATASP